MAVLLCVRCGIRVEPGAATCWNCFANLTAPGAVSEEEERPSSPAEPRPPSEILLPPRPAPLPAPFETAPPSPTPPQAPGSDAPMIEEISEEEPSMIIQGIAAGLIAGSILGALNAAFVYLLVSGPSNPMPTGPVIAALAIGLLPSIVLAVIIGIYLGVVADFDYEAAMLPVGILGAIAFGVTIYATRGFYWVGFVPLFMVILIGVATCWVWRRIWGPSWEMG